MPMITKILQLISCLAIIFLLACSPKNSQKKDLRISIKPSFSEECIFQFSRGNWIGYIVDYNSGSRRHDTLLEFQIDHPLDLDDEISLLNEEIEHIDILDGMSVCITPYDQESDLTLCIRNPKTIIKSGIMDALISSVEPNSIPELLLSEIKYFYLLNEEIPIFRENEFKKLLDFREQNHMESAPTGLY